MAKKYNITCTAFDRKGNVISSGTNSYTKTHPLARHFSILAGESPEKCRIHAELQAMLNAGSRKVYSVFVNRYDADGTTALAKPCRGCQLMLKAFGVVLARYTDKDDVQQDNVSSY
jgi:deoxycytidylate deaminase